MTEVYFTFDTEDFTSQDAWDASVRIANLLKKYGIKGSFNIVGYLAREWVRQGRLDVPAVLNEHDIGFHSLRHSYHPTVCEYTDVEDYNEARARLLALEGQGLGMVKAATGRQEIVCSSMPGLSISYVAYYEYAKLGIPINLGSSFRFADGRSFYFCNGLFLANSYNLETMFFEKQWQDLRHFDMETFPDYIAQKKCVLITNHPTRAVHSDFWDKINYNKVNKHPMYEWEETPKYTPEETEFFFEQFETLIKKLKNDDRFVIGSLADVKARMEQENARRVITRDQLPEILRQLKENLWYVRLSTGTFCLTDCFAAAAHFLHSDEPYKPAFVRGFLYAPIGVTETAVLSADEVRALAKPYEPDTFLPNVYEINGKKIGPADLLFAMLEVACGAKEVTLSPRPQLPELTDGYKRIAELNLKGSWIHAADFEDKYLTDRLRWQTWTIRE